MGKTLDELQAELFQVFGRLTKWRARCKTQNTVTESEQIELAKQVLSEPCTGTVMEFWGHSLQLQGATELQAPPYKSTGHSAT